MDLIEVPFKGLVEETRLITNEYHPKEWFEDKVGEVLVFQTPLGVRSGKLTKEGKDYYLPFCGSVRAETCRILTVLK